jgi:hypothetical protein
MSLSMNAPLTRLDRNGHHSLAAPLSRTSQLSRLLLEAAIVFAIVGAALVYIGWLAEGFVPVWVERESGDEMRTEEP